MDFNVEYLCQVVGYSTSPGLHSPGVDWPQSDPSQVCAIYLCLRVALSASRALLILNYAFQTGVPIIRCITPETRSSSS